MQTLSWLPVDCAAQSLIDILFAPPLTTVFHLENPIRQSWNDVLSIIAAELGLNKSNCMLSYEEWVAKVLDVSDEEINSNPAKKLAAFFEGDFERMAGGEVILDTAESRRFSLSLRTQQGVDESLMKKYISGWRKAGFLPSANM